MSCIYRRPTCQKNGGECDFDDECSPAYRGEIAAQETSEAAKREGVDAVVNHQHGQPKIALADAMEILHNHLSSGTVNEIWPDFERRQLRA